MKAILRVCPICKSEIKQGLWKHFWNIHKDSILTESEFLAKLLNLNSVPKCKNPLCNNFAKIDMKYYAFKDYCSKSCASSVAMTNRNKSEDFINLMKEVRHLSGLKTCKILHNDENYKNKMSDIHSKTFTNLYKIPEFRNKMRKVHSESLKKLWKNDEFLKHRKLAFETLYKSKRSKVEMHLFDKITELFPTYKILNNLHIGNYYPDILISELNLIIEVDGPTHYNKLDYDLNRDKFLSSLGYKVRRLSASICYKLKDSDIKYLITQESNLFIPYFDRIPYDQIFDWKFNIYQIGPKYLLEYRK